MAERKNDFWNRPITRRDLGSLLLSGIIGWRVTDNVSDRIRKRRLEAALDYISSTDEMNQILIEEGYATSEDLTQYQKISQQSEEVFRDFIHPELQSKYQIDEKDFKPNLGLKDLHERRVNRLPERGYGSFVSVRLHDNNTPRYYLGISIVLNYDQSEILRSASLGAFPGGSYIIEEIASIGEVKPGRFFFKFWYPRT